MNLDSFHPSEVVQVPAIVKGELIMVLTPDMNKLSPVQLKDMAEVMGGTLVFFKMRATYSDSGTKLCIAKDCFELGEKLESDTERKDWCPRHVNNH